MNDKYITIKPADKGSGVVVMNVKPTLIVFTRALYIEEVANEGFFILGGRRCVPTNLINSWADAHRIGSL